MTFELRSIHPDIGVEIDGVDLKMLDAQAFESVRNIIHQHGFALRLQA